jgi:flagellar hook-associated protein 2
MIQFGGLVSGLDTTSIVQSLVNLERNSIRRLEATRQQMQGALSAYSTLRSRLSDLTSVLEDMSDIDSFGKLSATSGDDGVLTATVSGEASEGVYEIEVQSLAAASKTRSDTFADKDTAGLFGTGTLTIGVNGVNTDITVDGSTTLTTLKDAINASGADVTASIVKSDAGFTLIVNGKSTGAANAVSFTEGGSLSLNLDELANQLNTAADATILIDNLFTVTSADNTLDDVLEGVSLSLKDTNVGDTVTLDIARDTESQVQAFQDFVDRYNAVISFVNQVTTPAQVGQTGQLINDSTLRGLRTRLQGVLQSAIPTGTNFEAASQIGFKTNANGTLTLDAAKLQDALSDDYNGVLNVFAKQSDGLAALFDAAIEGYTSSGGLLDSREDGLNDRIKDLNRRVDDQERRIDAYQARLEAQFLAMEQAISQLQNQSAAFSQAFGQ